jgi:DNA-binding transcriptional MocR family regulator
MQEKLRITQSYGVIPNNVLNNPNISFKAKGLFAYLQAKPANWNVSSRRICKETKDGRDSILSAMKELEMNGYLVRVQEKNKAGQWEWEHVLSAFPPEKGSPRPENPVLDNTDINKEIDINKYNTCGGEETPPEEPSPKENTNQIVKEVFDLFTELNLTSSLWWSNKTQRTAAIALNSRGLDKVRNALSYYMQNKLDKNIPLITTPYDLEMKWEKLRTHKSGIYRQED